VFTIRRKLMPRSSIFEPSGTEISAVTRIKELVQEEPARVETPRARCNRDRSRSESSSARSASVATFSGR
jgi:hypothetical protein